MSLEVVLSRLLNVAGGFTIDNPFVANTLRSKSANKNPDIAGAFADLGRLIIYKPSTSTNANAQCKSYFRT